MKLVIDVEANSLDNPTQIWCIVCKDIDTGEVYEFLKVTQDEAAKVRFLDLASKHPHWIGHNILGYDLPVLATLLGITFSAENTTDTLIISKLVDYSRKGHSIEDYGEEFDYPKIKFTDFSKFSEEMVGYCVRDVEIAERIYRKYSRVINSKDWQPSIRLEHSFQLIVNDLSDNGFAFNKAKAEKLLEKVTEDLAKIDVQMETAFPPREVLIREFTPRATKFGTISKTSVPRLLWDKIPGYVVGETYKHTKLEPFNPSSHKQLIEVLWEAGWKPVRKTKTHIDTERELQKLERVRERSAELDLKKRECYDKLKTLGKTGWKIDEENLATLPDNAPSPARLLAKRILLEARRRTLTEWLGLVHPDTNRIHGKFYGIGAWTHRMAHQNPNTANIPREFTEDGSVKLLGKEMRQLWIAPRNRLLVGVDAEGIQLRIFAHYIDDKEFTQSLLEGKKEDKSDPHSLNQRILGDACRTRQAAKRFIYALLLGAGIGKLAEILGCSEDEARSALDRLLERYKGFAYLKSQVIPADARRGYFTGLDGRRVRIPGDTEGSRRHLCMSGYLQNGEAVIMKAACLKWYKQLQEEDLGRWLFVNFVHDEWQTECANNMDVAIRIATVQANALREVGDELGLKCPMAGSYWNEDAKDYTIGTNWYTTH